MGFHLLCLTVRSLQSLHHSGCLGERHLQHLDSDDFHCHADLVWDIHCGPRYVEFLLVFPGRGLWNWEGCWKAVVLEAVKENIIKNILGREDPRYTQNPT